MNDFGPEVINALAQRWANLMWAISWQFWVVLLAGCILCRVFHRGSPQLRYWIWQIIAIKLLLMPFWTYGLPMSPRSELANEKGDSSIDTARENVLVAESAPLQSESSRTPERSRAPRSDVRKTAETSSRREQAPTLIIKATAADAAPSRSLPSADFETRSPNEFATSESRIDLPTRPETSRQSIRSDLVFVSTGDLSRTRPNTATKSGSIPNLPAALSDVKTASTQSNTLQRARRKFKGGTGHSSPYLNSESEQTAPEPTLALNSIRPVSVSSPASPAIEPLATRSGFARLTVQSLLMLTWFCGVMILATRIYWYGRLLRRALARTTPAPQEINEQVHQACRRLNVKQFPSVCLLEGDFSPFVCGFLRPQLILPMKLPAELRPEQFELVLLHEIAHIQRRDLLWVWVHEICRTLFFYHPGVHYLNHQIRFERELACDQLAIKSSGRDAATYAETLVQVIGFSTQSGNPPLMRTAGA